MNVLGVFVLLLIFIGNSEESDSEREDNSHLLIQQCMQEIELLKTTVNSQHKTIANLEFKMRNMENKGMNSDNSKTYTCNHTRKNWKLSSRTNQSEDSLDFKKIPTKLTGKVEMKNRTALAQRTKRQTSSIDVAESPVAFYSLMSIGEPGPSSHHTLVFDNVKTDTTKSYNRFSGIFTVPVEGIYVFSTTVYAHGYLSIDIVVNNEAVNTFYPDAGSTGMWISATGTAVVNVNAGDVVFVRTRSDYRPVGDIVSQKNMAEPSFSGWLLY